MSKAKDTIIDFSKSSYSSSLTIIKTADTGIAESYKYLGVVVLRWCFTITCVLKLMLMPLLTKFSKDCSF